MTGGDPDSDARPVDRAVPRLEALGPVDSWGMFGGWGLYIDGAMLAIVANDEVYLKVDEQTKQAFVDASLGPFTYEGKGRPMTMSFHRAPEPLEDWDALEPFARMALDAAARARGARAAKGRR